MSGIRMYSTYSVSTDTGTSTVHGPPVQIGELVYAVQRIRDIPRYDLEPILLQVVRVYGDCSIDVCLPQQPHCFVHIPSLSDHVRLPAFCPLAIVTSPLSV
jgi:hypothetical protein